MRELRGPKKRSARKLGMMRPRMPTPLRVMRRLMEEARDRCVMVLE
jgi:hypothetical protein